MNSIGRILRLTTFGESHGPAMGGILDGFPPGISIDFSKVREEMRTRQGGREGTTTRKEHDDVEFLSGFNESGVSLGTPIGFIIRNHDNRSRDYSELKNVYRPNHADYTTERRYGIRDYRGGGRASARETVSRVAAGALALQYLELLGVTVDVRLISMGHFRGETEIEFRREAERIKEEKDSVGALVECTIRGVSAGIGNPVYDKLSSRLGSAMLSINAVMGFEYGEGFKGSKMRGTQMADEFYSVPTSGEGSDGQHIPDIHTRTNHCGGIQGGISNGEDIIFRVAFKPTPTIGAELQTVDQAGREVSISSKGRHDPCVGIRGMAVVKSMAALTIADFFILHKGTGWRNE